MAFIKMIPENKAEGKLKQLYNMLTNGEAEGKVAHILKVHSLHPDVMQAHLNLYRTIMFAESGLSRTQREMIATTVSASNACEY